MISALLLSLFLAGPSSAAQLPPATSSSTVAVSLPPINVIYPTEAEVLPTLKNQWLIGSVADPRMQLKINGQDVAVYRTGAFLAWLAVAPGTFTFHCETRLETATAAFDRTVFISPPPMALPPRPISINASSIEPGGDVGLRPGDWLTVRMQATSGLKAKFKLPGHSWSAMREIDKSLGIYEGIYQVKPGEVLAPAHVRLSAGGFWGVSARSRGRVSFDSSRPRVAQVAGAEPVSVKTEPGHGERFSLPPGTLLNTEGFSGPYTKVSIDPSWVGWVDTSSLRLLPKGTKPPEVEVQTIVTHAQDRGARVSISLSKPVPFTIEEDPGLQAMTVRLYSAKDHVNWIVYDSSDSLIDQISASQESSEVVRIRVRLKPGEKLWGYHSEFTRSALEIELRSPPKLAKAPASALNGLSIFLDPGHMPSAPGAVGPLGTLEMDVNFAIAGEVRALLDKEGARVILSRQNDAQEVSLVDRPAKAWQEQADLYVSIHNNNLSDGENPFSSAHGYSIFYYQPHSLDLAREIHKQYEKFVNIPDENLRYGDLYVLRMTEMPSVLTESAYLSLPDQEALLLTPDFRKQLAVAIVGGLRQFLENERSRQKKHVL